MIKSTVNEPRLGYGMSCEAQGRCIMMSGVNYYNQISYNVDLWDNNYHLIVNLLVKLFHDRNIMIFESLEWLPNMDMFGDSIKDTENENVDEDGDSWNNVKSEK